MSKRYDIKQSQLDIAFSKRNSPLMQMIADMPKLMMQYELARQDNTRFEQKMQYQKEADQQRINMTLIQNELDKKNVLEQDLRRLTTEASNLSYTYQNLSKVDDANKTGNSTAIGQMSMDQLNSFRNSLLSDISDTEKNIAQLNKELSAFKSGALASRDFEINLTPGLQADEIAAYRETLSPAEISKIDYRGPADMTYTDGTPLSDEDKRKVISKRRVAEAYKLGFQKPDTGTMRTLKAQVEARQQKDAIPLSMGIKKYDKPEASFLDPSYIYGGEFVKKYKNLTAPELHQRTIDPNVSYFDQVQDIFDYSDIDALKMGVVEEALNEVKNSTQYTNDVGLGELKGTIDGMNIDHLEMVNGVIVWSKNSDGVAKITADLDVSTNKMKPILDYFNNATQNAIIGVNQNTNFKIVDKSILGGLRAGDVKAKAIVYQEGIDLYKAAPEDIRALISETVDDVLGPRGGEDKIESITKELQDEKYAISEGQVAGIINSLIRTKNTLSMATYLSNPVVKEIIKKFDGGEGYLNQYEKVALPAYTASQQSDYVPVYKKRGRGAMTSKDLAVDDLMNSIKNIGVK